MEWGDVGQTDSCAAHLPVRYPIILCHTQSAAAQTGDDRGGNSDPDDGQSAVCTGLCEAGNLHACFYGTGEAVPGNLLFNDFMTRLDIRINIYCEVLSDRIRSVQ